MSAGQPARTDDDPAPAVTPRRSSEAPPFRPTETGNAELFAHQHEGNVHYAETLGWIVWDSTRYRRDDLGEVERLARETVKSLYAVAAETIEPKTRAAIAEWARKSDCYRGVANMLELAKSELAIVLRPAAFDRNPFELNTLSGIVDLRSGSLSEHSPSARLTKLAGAFYSPDVRCPKWLTFLDEIMGGDLEMVDYLQRVVGYSLTGDTSEQCLFMPYGSGANGKSQFIEAVRAVLGDYAANASSDTFMVKRGEGPRPDIARLRSARFVSTVETDDGGRLAESLVKTVTGGDTITARFLYREEFEFRPQFKLFIATNHKPTVRGSDYAIWRRIRLLPFDVTIPEGKREKDIGHRLVREEGAAILAWAVEGCRRWLRDGLQDPAKVKAATATYKDEQDPVAQFLEDRTTLEPGARAYNVYPAYLEWCKANGRTPLNAMNLSLRLQERGFPNGREHGGRFFEGFTLEGWRP